MEVGLGHGVAGLRGASVDQREDGAQGEPGCSAEARVTYQGDGATLRTEKAARSSVARHDSQRAIVQDGPTDPPDSDTMSVEPDAARVGDGIAVGAGWRPTGVEIGRNRESDWREGGPGGRRQVQTGNTCTGREFSCKLGSRPTSPRPSWAAVGPVAR